MRPRCLSSPLFVASRDLRPLVADYFPINLLTCPLSPEISLLPEDTGVGAVWANYDYWSAWQYKPQGATAEVGMFRIGDRWSWNRTNFRLLVSDRELVYDFKEGQSTESSHPDSDGIMASVNSKDQSPDGARSFWWSDVDKGRGTLDLNAAWDDASVLRRRDLVMRDPRSKWVPFSKTNAATAGRYVPAD